MSLFQCVCRLVYSSSQSLWDHLSVDHMVYVPWSCDCCDARFPSRTLALAHLKAAHSIETRLANQVTLVYDGHKKAQLDTLYESIIVSHQRQQHANGQCTLKVKHELIVPVEASIPVAKQSVVKIENNQHFTFPSLAQIESSSQPHNSNRKRKLNASNEETWDVSLTSDDKRECNELESNSMDGEGMHVQNEVDSNLGNAETPDHSTTSPVRRGRHSKAEWLNLKPPEQIIEICIKCQICEQKFELEFSVMRRHMSQHRKQAVQNGEGGIEVLDMCFPSLMVFEPNLGWTKLKMPTNSCQYVKCETAPNEDLSLAKLVPHLLTHFPETRLFQCRACRSNFPSHKAVSSHCVQEHSKKTLKGKKLIREFELQESEYPNIRENFEQSFPNFKVDKVTGEACYEWNEWCGVSDESSDSESARDEDDEDEGDKTG